MFSYSTQCPASSPAPRILRDHQTVKIIRHLVMTENTLITCHLARKRPNPNGRALLTDVNARVAVHAINALALQKQQRSDRGLNRPAAKLRLGAYYG